MPEKIPPPTVTIDQALLDRESWRQYFDYYHSQKPIPAADFTKLWHASTERWSLGYHPPGLLLFEYVSAQIYKQFLPDVTAASNVYRVGYFASGSDALPAHIFGTNRVVMTTLNPQLYYPLALQHQRHFADAAKLEADLFAAPFANTTFSLLITSGVNIFQPAVLEFIQQKQEGKNKYITEATPAFDWEVFGLRLQQLCQEMFRVSQDSAQWLIFLPTSVPKQIIYEVQPVFAQAGWQLSYIDTSTLLPSNLPPNQRFEPIFLVAKKAKSPNNLPLQELPSHQ